MKVFIGYNGPIPAGEPFGKFAEVVACHAPFADKAHGCDAAVINCPGFLDLDMREVDRREVAFDEVVRFAWRLMERKVRVAAFVSPVLIPAKSVRRVFPTSYVSEHRHYPDYVTRDVDLERPATLDWLHLWIGSTSSLVADHQHVFFFHDVKASATDAPNWDWLLRTALIEAEHAYDPSITRGGIGEILAKAEARWKP